MDFDMTANKCYKVFQRSIEDYHNYDSVDSPMKNPYSMDQLEFLLYSKNWIDSVQWHLEDIIRLPDINPDEALKIKRRIDKSNQDRTDTVERMDDYFLEQFGMVKPKPGARINSETPAWLLDRMSILMLKIFHMEEQVNRQDANDAHRGICKAKLAVLNEQKSDLALAFDQMIEDIGDGVRKFKVYRQMKMYNDASLNPVLYGSKK